MKIRPIYLQASHGMERNRRGIKDPARKSQQSLNTSLALTYHRWPPGSGAVHAERARQKVPVKRGWVNPLGGEPLLPQAHEYNTVAFNLDLHALTVLGSRVGRCLDRPVGPQSTEKVPRSLVEGESYALGFRWLME